jgi:hypothetical protein
VLTAAVATTRVRKIKQELLKTAQRCILIIIIIELNSYLFSANLTAQKLITKLA